MKGLAAAAAVLCLAACGDSTEAPIVGGVRQTRQAGMISAGGHTSGEVMAASSKPGSAQPGPAGTPGIPKGAEGNVGGTAMGGTTPATTPGQAPAGPAPAGGAPGPAPAAAPGAGASAALAPASAAAAPALSDAQRQQQALVASMDAVAARWRSRAVAQGATPPPPVAEAGTVGVQASASPPIRSEKFGTAPPSPDVKTATKPATEPVVDRKSPKQAGPSP